MHKLHYTGHPLLDVGVATITAFANKENPADLTENDLHTIADYLKKQYDRTVMRSMLSVVFTINYPFTNSTIGDEKRAADIESLLYSWKEDVPRTEETCVFFGIPATRRAYRETIPLIGSIKGFNFYAGGDAGLPISGEALLAIQAFPLGCTMCEGRVLLLHSDHPDLTYSFALETLEQNRRHLNMASQDDKYAGSSYPRTQIISRLIEAEQQRREVEHCSLTAYHLTNYGTSASIDLYHLPQQVIAFIYQASDAAYQPAWNRLIQRGWEGGDGTTTEPPDRDDAGRPARRNVLYEDLFTLPADAHRFLRTYLLRTPRIAKTRKDDQRRTYHLASELDMVSWSLTNLFLERILNVDKERIEAIQTMADRIAAYIRKENDRNLLYAFLMGRNEWKGLHHLQNRLIKADYNAAKQGDLIFSLEEFTSVFYNSEDRYWWIIARDLVLIRIIEQLHHNGWFKSNADVLEQAEPSEPESITE